MCIGDGPSPLTTFHERNQVMNELRLLDPFLRDPFDDTLRGLMRPWRVGLLDGSPRMRIHPSEQDDSEPVKASNPGLPQGGTAGLGPRRRQGGRWVALGQQPKCERGARAAARRCSTGLRGG